MNIFLQAMKHYQERIFKISFFLFLSIFLNEVKLSYGVDLGAYVTSAKASSIQERKYPAEYAFDGDLSTRWSSAFRNGEWIEGNFHQSVQINEILIHWETARAADYTVLVQGEKGDWLEISKRQGLSSQELPDKISVPPTLKILKIKILCDRRATSWGNSIFEIQLKGHASSPPPSQNLIGWKVPPTPWEKRERKIAEQLLSKAKLDPPTSIKMTDEELLNLIQKKAFSYFWWETNPENGLTKDRGCNFQSSEELTHSSIAAVGYALTAYVIGVERGWISREKAVQRVKRTLKTFVEGPVRNVKGFYPHFVDYFTGKDIQGTEISTIDTALLLAGVITVMEYFKDTEIYDLSRKIYERVDWNWARSHHAYFVSHGLDSSGRFIDIHWGTMTEGILIYLLGLGSPAHPLPDRSWDEINRYIGEFDGYEFVIEYGFQSIFRYQYPALWYDFRGKIDHSGMDYFENATLATLAMRQYCIREAARFPLSYHSNSWGLGAADGPGNTYKIYGFPPGEPYSPTDGTVVPYAIAGSISFVPRHAIQALRYLYDHHHNAWGKYGFADSVNPTQGFVTRDALGLDLGTIIVAIENYRSGLIWRLFMNNPWIRSSTNKIDWKPFKTSSVLDGPIDLARTQRWYFRTGDGNFKMPNIKDPSWKEVTVPDRWENYDSKLKDYDGIGWYSVPFSLEKDRITKWLRSGKPIIFSIGGADDEETVYLNGIKIGQTKAGPDIYKKRRDYKIPRKALRSGQNVISIRVVDNSGPGGIWKTPIQIGPQE